MSHHDVLIIGAGAAGLMCAITAHQRGRRVLLLDHAREPGAKILISGGGRCNFTNTGTTPERFLSENPHFARSALGRHTPEHFIALLNRHRIPFHEKTLGQLFCDGSARQIVTMLMTEAEGVEMRFGHQITGLSKSDYFNVETDHGRFTAASLVLATGGLSIPKLGATNFAHEAARHFGLRVTEVRPGLVPLTFEGNVLDLMRPLAGVSFPAEVSLGRRHFTESALFTHRGLSGPSILQISSYWRDGPIALNLFPGQDPGILLTGLKRTRPKAELRTVLSDLLPRRLITALDIPPTRLADMRDDALRSLAAGLRCWTVTPSGTEGYAKAEVTVGGIDTRDLSSRTMEATNVPGLFAIGEAVDVTGWLGGYNFQWAWASGWCAGQAA